MRRFSLGARLTVLAAAISAVAIAVTAGGAGAAGMATLNLQVFPGQLLPGGAGAILATFTNTGPSTLNHVVVNVNLNGATFDSASSAGCAASSTGATCSLVGGGSIVLGTTVYTTIAFTHAPSSGTRFAGSATVNSQTKGKPNGNPGNQVFTIPAGGGTYSLLSATNLAGTPGSTCSTGTATTSSNGDNHQIDVTAGGNTAHLTCTPVTVGIDNSGSTDILFTKMPALSAPANVTLTFPDDLLPWPSFESPPGIRDVTAPAHLYEYPNYPSTSGQVEVGACDPGPALPASPAAGFSGDACIVSISSTDESAGGDNDADAGTISLLVQGSNTGDSGFHGG